MSPARSASAQADHNLAPEQFPDLNREFYRADPADYIRRRLAGLVISIADSPALRDALAQGVQYGKFRLRREPDAEIDNDAVKAYASLESTNLLHHAAECLLRLYLAHANMPPCPWLEVARLRAPREFKERIEQLRNSLQEPETIDSLRTIFFGNTSPERLGMPFTPEEWQRKTDGLLLLIEHLCTTVLGDAALYNATKHGLAVVGGSSGLQLAVPELTISTDGPGLSYLDMTPADAPGGRQWTKNLTFVRIEANLGLIEIISSYIRSLWHIAKYRYVGNTSDQPPVIAMIEPEMLAEVIQTGLEGPYSFAGMAMPLLYYADDEPGAADAFPPVSQPTRSDTGSTAASVTDTSATGAAQDEPPSPLPA